MSNLVDKGIVISVPEWKVPVISKKKLLQQPAIAVDIKFDPAEVKAMPDKQSKIFEAEFNKSFDKKFNEMSKSWFDMVQKELDIGEENIEKLVKNTKDASEKFLKSLVEPINQKLVKMCVEWTKKAEEVATKAYEAALAASYSAMKLKLVKAKAKVIAKVVLIVLVTLTAAAVTIAASVLTAGAGAAIAPIVLKAIAVGGKAIYSSIKEISDAAGMLDNKLKEVAATTKKLSDASSAFTKAAKPFASKLDKAKAFQKALAADIGTLDKQVGQLDKFITEQQGKSKKRAQQIKELNDALDKAGKSGSKESLELQKKLAQAEDSQAKAVKNLEKIADAKKAAEEAKTAFKEASEEGMLKALGKLAPIVSFLQNVGPELSKAGTAIKTIAEMSVKIAGG